MGYEYPRLDDRAFADLVEEARRRIPLYTPEWTDYNLSDPGITLIELFAWMTDIVLYRLNRVPDKHYVKFIELLGMRLREAEPARVPLTFWLTAPQELALKIPGGTVVATQRSESEDVIEFSTDYEVKILVPTLSNVLSSGGGAGGGRRFKVHNPKRLAEGVEGFLLFDSTPPQAGDAAYFGFDEDLSHHILGIEMEVDTAEGAGIDPTDPPYLWEVMAKDGEGWTKLEVDLDGTKGFNVSGLVRLFLPELVRGTRNGVSAYWVRVRLSPQENMRSYDVSPMVRRLIATTWGISVPSTNVTSVRSEVLGRSDGSPGQVFELAHTPVVPRIPGEVIIVRTVEGEEQRWSEVADFAESGPEDRHYTLDSRTGAVRFGPALRQRDGSMKRYGAILPNEAMVVMRAYRYGGGSHANVGPRTLNVITEPIPYVAQAMNRVSAQGGLNAESLEDAKTRLPGYLRTLQRAVTPQDYEYLAKQAMPGAVGRVYCLQPPNTAAGEVGVLVIPHVPNIQGFIAPESLQLNEELRARVASYLDERRLLGTRLEVRQPRYQWIQTEIRFRPSAHIDHDQVTRAVQERLFNFLNPLIGGNDGKGWPFGRGLFTSDIMSVLLTVNGVDFVRSVRLFPVNFEGGDFAPQDEVSEITVQPDGVIVSYEHIVKAE
jgi:predicted phage baseplate assembly protein